MSTKRKSLPLLGQPMVKQSAKALEKANLDESKTVVTGGNNSIKSRANGVKEFINISSDSESEAVGADDSDEESLLEEETGAKEGSDAGEDVAMKDALNSDEESVESSFGDRVKENAAKFIDVAEAFEEPISSSVAKINGSELVPKRTSASLGTVLAQALRTNDVQMLESCLQTTDINVIRATIQRLDSSLAGELLQRLAERIHRKPGRSGSLMVWVQWTLVTNGGYLATQPHLINKLTALNKVIDERAKGLPSLLSLKGKLDMLEAQIELRRGTKTGSIDEDDDEEAVIYVEEPDQVETDEGRRLAMNGALEDGSDISDAASDISEDMPLVNGLATDSEDEEDDDSEGEGEGFVDDEAEETDADSGDDEAKVDHDAQDDVDEEVESDDGIKAAPRTKIPRTSLFSKRR